MVRRKHGFLTFGKSDRFEQMTEEQYKIWMGQWKFAEKELAQQKAYELAHLDDQKAREMSYSLLSSAPHEFINSARRETSGLVEQQKWFSKWKG